MDERRTGEYRTGVAVKKLVLSEELRNKHGEIYSAMPDAANKTLDAHNCTAEAHIGGYSFYPRYAHRAG